MTKLLALPAVALFALAACSSGDDTGDPTPASTGADCDMPVGEPCPSDEDESVDRWAEYTRCIADDEVPNDECPTPEEQLRQQQP